jgi:hypothetical protein
VDEAARATQEKGHEIKKDSTLDNTPSKQAAGSRQSPSQSLARHASKSTHCEAGEKLSVCYDTARDRNAPVGMALIDDDIAQVRQDAAELAVHGQDAAVEHVGVRDEQLRAVPCLPADALQANKS